MLEKQLYRRLCALDRISDPTLFSQTFWENYFSFWPSYWNLDRFGWNQLKLLKKQLCRQNRSSFQYRAQNENRAPRKIRSLNMCLEIISDWHRPGKLHRNVLPTPPSLSLDPIVRQSWDNCLYRRGGYAKRDGAICWACVHPRAFLRTHLENKFFEPLNSRLYRRIENMTGLPGNSWF